jgi:hypothetical protein
VPDLANLTSADFAPLLHDRFRVDPGERPPFEVELIEVSEIPREPGGRTPFSLVFAGGPSPPLGQRVYRVEHEDLGALEIFLVPVAANRYEAIFT